MVLAFLGHAEWVEPIGIAFAVFIATFVATWSEFKNEASFRELQEKASRLKNNVFRGGEAIEVLASDIVVGDYVLLQEGDKVPADGKLLYGELYANQASLTGENEALAKTPAPEGYEPASRELSDPHLLFRGSVIDEGEGVMIVDKVGVNTFSGALEEELAEKDTRESPLQVKLANLANQISMVGYIGATLIAISFLFKQFVMDQGYSWQAMLTYVQNWQDASRDTVTAIILAIIVIVVAVPEGLPMMIAIVLSLNMRKLLKEQVLVRRLLGIETAGSLNILFADKTGTLTFGQFQPAKFVSGSLNTYDTYESVPKGLRTILAFSLKEATSAHITSSGKLIGGNSSDRALLQFVSTQDRHKSEDVVIEKEILFSSKHKFSAVQVSGLLPKGMCLHPSEGSSSSTKEGELLSGTISLVKGATDEVLKQCTTYYDDEGWQQPLTQLAPIINEIDYLSTQGIRVIAVATSDEPLEDSSKTNRLPSNMALVGIVGVLDQVRPESPEAVATAQRAGIQVVMITGDRKETAAAVAKEVGLLRGTKREVITSEELNSMSDKELKQLLPRLSVVARALPTDKSRLVRVAQEQGKVVGMTGDGVNDSSALKKADVGFAIGSGSAVAKEAADIVILDDNFRSITRAILYGRTIFKSIRKFIVFQSTVNVGAMVIAFLGPFIGYDFPLTLIQLLWVNLVMDTLAALAFGGEAALNRYMNERPVERTQSIISPAMWSSIIINGLFITLLCHIFLTYDGVEEVFRRDGQPDQKVFLTAFFAFFIFLTTFNAFNVRTTRLNIFDNIHKNTGFVVVVTLIFLVQITFTWIGGSVLRTVPLTLNEWLSVIVASSIIIPFDFLRKTLLIPCLGTRPRD
ncbi:P-type Ca(2+) transporter [Balamuthia mandrillaris]